MPDIVDNEAAGRFELQKDGKLAVLTYRVHNGRLALLHTEVPEDLGGQGLGSLLVETALDRARRDGLTVVPYCRFARWWIEKHPESVEDVPVELPAA